MIADEETLLSNLLLSEEKTIKEINNSIGPIIYPINKINGFIIDKVPKDILDKLQIYLDTFNLEFPNSLPSNHYSLAGNLQNQYSLPIDLSLEDYIYWLCDVYNQKFPKFLESVYYSNAIETEQKLKPYLYSLWVNFMKKYEFNPPHTHSGKFSFVIWYKVPYKIEDEIRQGPSKRLDHTNLAGTFQFSYPQFSEEGIGFTNIRADCKYDGKICLFPSYLHHTVYPFFTSDDYRISIAGNIKYKNNEI